MFTFTLESKLKKMALTKKQLEVVRQVKEKLIELQVSDDTEGAHYLADDCLCRLLTELGQQDVVDKYKNITKWYA